MTNREPLLKPVPIAELRPTQMTVGYREVAEKRRRWREYDGEKKKAFLGAHMIPTLLGPKKHHYIIDHHHLSRALHEEGVESVLVTVVADLHYLDKDAFWTVCDHKSWVHPYDAEGVRQDFKEIPKSVDDLADDPYPQPRRRAAPGRWLRQGHDPVQRVPVGRLPAAQRQGEAHRGAISPPPWRRRCRSPSPRMPTTSPAGAGDPPSALRAAARPRVRIARSDGSRDRPEGRSDRQARCPRGWRLPARKSPRR